MEEKNKVLNLKKWNVEHGQWFKNSQLKYRLKHFQELVKGATESSDKIIKQLSASLKGAELLSDLRVSENSLPDSTPNNDVDEILRSLIGSEAPERSSDE